MQTGIGLRAEFSMAAKPNKLLSEMVVFTANRLRDGRVIWLRATGPSPDWSADIAEALVMPGTDIAAAEAAAAAGEAAQFLVGAYAVAVKVTDSGPMPLRERERIRVHGPSAGSTRPRQAA